MTFRNRLRQSLHKDQGGVCYWHPLGRCLRPDIPLNLSEPYRIKGIGKNPLHASFEHLKLAREGGEFTAENIRLAHAICNWSRERKQ